MSLYQHLAYNIITADTVLNKIRFCFSTDPIPVPKPEPDLAGYNRTTGLMTDWIRSLSIEELCCFIQCVTGEYGLVDGKTFTVSLSVRQ
jgi:hypothetical protein